MKPSFLEKLAPASLPQQIAQLSSSMERIASGVEAMSGGIDQLNKPTRDPDPIWLDVPFNNTSDLLLVTGLLASGTISGVYRLSVGAAVKLSFYLLANAPLWMPMSPLQGFAIGRGLAVSVTGPTDSVYLFQIVAVPKVA